MNNVTPLPSMQEHLDGCLELSNRLRSAIEQTVKEHPNMTSVSVIGILRLVEINFIARLPCD